MSLTLNVSKEARLFYKNEEKIREFSEERMIQPSSTIHMKKYSPAQSSTLRSPNSHLFKISDESSDECPASEGPDQRRDDWMSSVEKNGGIVKRRRIQSQRENNSRFIPTSSSNPSHQSSFKYSHHLRTKGDNHLNQSLKLKHGSHRRRLEKGNYLEKHRKQNQKEGVHQEEIKQKHSPRDQESGYSMTDDIPPRDLNGKANDSDGMAEKLKLDHVSYDDISPAQDLHHLEDSFEMSEDENHNISENNPFAKQRILNSKYKNMYSG